jgi:opacity protein-like surface antigen
MYGALLHGMSKKNATLLALLSVALMSRVAAADDTPSEFSIGVGIGRAFGDQSPEPATLGSSSGSNCIWRCDPTFISLQLRWRNRFTLEPSASYRRDTYAAQAVSGDEARYLATDRQLRATLGYVLARRGRLELAALGGVAWRSTTTGNSASQQRATHREINGGLAVRWSLTPHITLSLNAMTTLYAHDEDRADYDWRRTVDSWHLGLDPSGMATVHFML